MLNDTVVFALSYCAQLEFFEIMQLASLVVVFYINLWHKKFEYLLLVCLIRRYLGHRVDK